MLTLFFPGFTTFYWVLLQRVLGFTKCLVSEWLGMWLERITKTTGGSGCRSQNAVGGGGGDLGKGRSSWRSDCFHMLPSLCYLLRRSEAELRREYKCQAMERFNNLKALRKSTCKYASCPHNCCRLAYNPIGGSATAADCVDVLLFGLHFAGDGTTNRSSLFSFPQSAQ